MTNKLAFIAAAATAISLPALAQAQTAPGFTGTVSLGYSTSSINDVPGLDATLSGFEISAETDISFGDSFGVGLDFSVSSGELDIGGGLGGGIDLGLNAFAIEPAYYFGNGAYVGAYYRMGDADLSLGGLPISLGIDTSAYGLFAGYEQGALWVEGFVGMSDTDPSLPGDTDIRDYGLAASYDISDQFEIYGSVLRTDIDLFGSDFDLTALAIGADYDFANGLTAYGSLGTLDLGLGGLGDFDAKSVTLGVSYDLSASAASTPVILSAEVSRTMIDLGGFGIDPEIDRLAVGITIPLGGSGEFLSSNTRTARGDYRSAIAALVNSL